MRYILVLLFIIPVHLLAQNKPAELQIRTGYYDTLARTTGIRLEVTYFCSELDPCDVATADVTLEQQQKIIYNQKKRFFVTTNGQQKQFYLFIPYRLIDLEEGWQQNVGLICDLYDKGEVDTVINFMQPRRYAINIDLKRGKVKETLLPYDQTNNVVDRAPDPFFEFSVNNSTQAIYTSDVTWNTFSLSPQKIAFYILQHDTLQWHFYDKDGLAKVWLGTYDNFKSAGDFTDEVYGKMFGSIKELTFTINQTEAVIQPITIYNKGKTTEYKRKGVRWQVRYDMSKAYVGKKMLPILETYAKDGSRLDLEYYESATAETPTVGVEFPLEKRGVLSYFIPFYAWDNTTAIVKFKFEGADNEVLEAAPYFLHAPIQFGALAKQVNSRVAQDYRYKGVDGVLVTMDYKVARLDNPTDLELDLGPSTGTAFIINDKTNPDIAFSKHPYIVKKAKVMDEIQVFIPYSQLSEKEIRVKLGLVLDYKFNLIEEVVPINRYGEKDIELAFLNAKPGFLNDNYGHQFNIVAEIPNLFSSNRERLFLKVMKNGTLFEEYRYTGNIKSREGEEGFHIKGDSIQATILIPSRLLGSKDKITFSAAIRNKNGDTLSTVINESWTAPNQLWNKNVRVNLEQFTLERFALQDTTITWQYLIEVGDKVVHTQQLPSKVSSQNKGNYSTVVYVNREDNLKIYVQNNKTKQREEIWKGDWSKLGSNNYVIEVKKRRNLKKIRVSFEEKK
jgi:hypothetical protein